MPLAALQFAPIGGFAKASERTPDVGFWSKHLRPHATHPLKVRFILFVAGH